MRRCRRAAQPRAPLRAMVAGLPRFGPDRNAERADPLHAWRRSAHARVHGVAVLEATEDMIETHARQAGLDDRPRPRRRCAACATTRPPTAAHARAIAERIADLLHGWPSATARQTTRTATTSDDSPIRFSLWMDFDAQQDEGPAVAVTERSKALDAAGGGYRDLHDRLRPAACHRRAGAHRTAARVPRAARPPHRRERPQRQRAWRAS